MVQEKRVTINSEEDLKKHSVAILRTLNRSERNGLLFLLNPVLAQQDAGFDLNLEMRRHIKIGLRCGSDTKKQLRELQKEISKEAGYEIHAASNVQVARLLFDELKLQPPPLKGPVQLENTLDESETYESEIELEEAFVRTNHSVPHVKELKEGLRKRGLSTIGSKNELISRLKKFDETVKAKPRITLDLLETMRDQHPVIPKLIEMRRLLRDGWQFVNRETYERVKAGASVTLLRGVKFKKTKRESSKNSWKGDE